MLINITDNLGNMVNEGTISLMQLNYISTVHKSISMLCYISFFADNDYIGNLVYRLSQCTIVF